MAISWDGRLLVLTPSTRWQRVIITAILSPLLLLLIVPLVPTLLVVSFLPVDRQRTVLSILDRYITCIMALAGIDTGSSPEPDRHGQADQDDISSTSQTTGTLDDRVDLNLKASAVTPVQQGCSVDRTGIRVALWIGIVTCFGVLVAAALAHGVLQIAGMLFGVLATGITALWLIRTFLGGPGAFS